MFDKTAQKRHAPQFAAARQRFAARHNLRELAQDMATNAQVLRNKFSDSNPHELTVVELIDITQRTGDQCLLNGLLLDLEMSAIRLPSSNAPATDTAITTRALDISATGGELGRAALEITATGRVTRDQRDTTISRATALMGQLALFVHDIEAKFQAVPMLSCGVDVLFNAMPVPGLS